MEYFQKDSIKCFNVKNIEMKDNYFGFPIGLPVALVSFQSGGSSCPEPLPFSSVTGITISGNTAVRADWSLVEVDHTYSNDILEKVKVDTTVLLMPCACDDLASSNNQTNVSNSNVNLFLTLNTINLGSDLQASTYENRMLWRGGNPS